MLSIDLNNQVAIVSGVTSGIGAGIAKILAKAGCHIAGCGKSEPETDGAQNFINSVKSEGRNALYIKCDVADDIAIKEFVDQSYQFFGRINILISNAGSNVFKGAEECSLEDWDYNIRLNYRSHWLISKYCKPYLDRSEKAFILIMTSNHAYSTIPGTFPYNTTKAGLTGMVNALATEWGPHIRVVGLAPGFIETAGGESWFQQFDDPQAEKLKTIKRHPAGKLGTPEEVGAFCAFLASDFAGFITGVTYLMDGGRSSIMQDE